MKVTFGQQTTKVKQLADLLSQEISMGKYRSDCTLPSINKLTVTIKYRGIQYSKHSLI